jgi:serine/threonine-protein kinase HipA
MLNVCGNVITTPDTAYFNLPDGQAAFATRRLTVTNRPYSMQSLAAFTGAITRYPVL